MNQSFDILVIGGGPAGSYIALKFANDGFKVGIVDKNQRTNFWFKHCGSIVSPTVFDFFKKVDIEVPDAAKTYFETVKVFDNQLAELAMVKLPLVHLDRVILGKTVIDKIVQNDIQLFDNNMAIKLILDKNTVKGVQLQTGDKIYSRIVIDATGYIGLLRSQLLQLVPIWRIDKEDVELAIMTTIKGRSIMETLSLIVDKTLFPGGYGWVTPNKNSFTVGLGLQPIIRNISLHGRLSLLRKLLGVRGEYTPPGVGLIYARRPFGTLVYNGYALVGESGSQGNPLFGGGILGALIAADMAFKSIKNCIENSINENPTISDLWRYNIDFMKDRGKFLAILDALRIFVQGLSNEELKELASYLPPKVSLKLRDTVKIGLKALKTIAKSRIFWRIFDAYRAAIEVQRLYEKYPKKPEDFAHWSKSDNELFAKLKEKLLKK